MGFFDVLKPKNIMVDQSNVQPVQPVRMGAVNNGGSLEFVVFCDGDDEEAALKGLVELIESGFND